MDTKTQMQLALKELRESFSEFSRESREKAEVSLSIFQKLLEREINRGKSLHRDLGRQQEDLDSEKREAVEDALGERIVELEKREMELRDREKVPSPEYLQTKRRLNNSDDLLIRYLDNSLKPVPKQHVEYYIKEDRNIRERLDQLTKLTDKITEVVSEAHKAPIPDEAKKLMATLADKLDQKTVTEQGSQSKTTQGIFKRLMDEWLAPGFVGAGVAAAAVWTFFVIPSSVMLVEGSTDLFPKPYIQNIEGKYKSEMFRGPQEGLDRVKVTISKALEERYALSKIVEGDSEITIKLNSAFVSEKVEHCDLGELSYEDQVTFFIGCRETENNWNVKFSE